MKRKYSGSSGGRNVRTQLSWRVRGLPQELRDRISGFYGRGLYARMGRNLATATSVLNRNSARTLGAVGRVAGGSAASGFNPYATAALTAGELFNLGYQAYKDYKGYGKKKGSGVKGLYRGKFKRPKKKQDLKGKVNGYYSGKGVMRIVETHGTVSAPDAVYVGQSTYYPYEIAATIAIAIIKKVLIKAGMTVGGNKEPLSRLFSRASGGTGGAHRSLLLHPQ
ncbi:MAG: hypothetical protein ABT940_14540, partial [Alphaproteobacteria bacterium]